MNRTLAGLALSLGVVVSVAAQSPQTRFGVALDDERIALNWLSSNCLAPSAKSMIDELLARRAAMQIAFGAAVAQGPTATEVAQVREAAVVSYRRQREIAARPELRGVISPEVLRSVEGTSEADFVRAEVENFINGYRSNALSGLAIVGDESTQDRLKALALERSGPLAAGANAALAYRYALQQEGVLRQ